MERIKIITLAVWGERHKILRYLFSGGTAAAADFFFLYVLTEWIGFHYLVSVVIAFVFAVIISFILQKYWTFQDHSRNNLRWQATTYVIIASVNTVFNTFLVYFFVEYINWHYLVGQFVSSGLIAFESFFVYQLFIFKNGSNDHLRAIKLIIPILFIVLFFALRLPGVSLPYHQDEWKNVSAAATVAGAGSFFAHPPLMQIMFVTAHRIFGADYFRLFPLLFALVSTFLLYFVVKNRLNKRAAIWAIFLYITSFYGILGSLFPDVDGAILPFFFLLAVYTYDRWLDVRKLKWFLLLFTVLLIGWLIKLSFVLVAGTLVVDYIFNQWRNITIRKVVLGVIVLIGFSFVYTALLYLIQFIYPAFNLGIMFGHANQFVEDVGRNWIQIIIQGTKAVFYLSPLLFIPLLYLNKETLKRLRIFFVYLVLGFIFYFILFDFSRGALDKYLMFAIIPLVTIGGAIFGDIFNSSNKAINKKFLFIFLGVGVVISGFLLSLNFLPHSVVPLYPKEEWFNRVFRFDWKVLNPFNGGSGPMGFYVSFLFIAVSFVVSIALGIIGYFKKEWRAGIIVILIIISVTYNLIFTEELILGKINGSAPKVLDEVVVFITNSKDVKKVLTYNDIGNHELSAIGKYAGRIYATPQSEIGYKKKFAEFNGHYLIIDIPKLSGFYKEFFADCQPLFETSSGKISGRVYDCPQNQ